MSTSKDWLNDNHDIDIDSMDGWHSGQFLRLIRDELDFVETPDGDVKCSDEDFAWAWNQLQTLAVEEGR